MRRFGAHRQTGFSLVELMVAMVLGLIITGAAISLFSTNQRTFSLQQNMARIQEQGDLAMRFINQDVRLAGKMSKDIDANFLPGIILDATTAGIPPGEDDDGNGNDRLTLAYHGERDCQGKGPGAGEAEIVNTYWVEEDEQGEPALYCEGNQSDDKVILLRGVKSFQVLYGVDQNNDNVASVSQYLRADQVLASTVVDQQQIVSVRIGLLLEAELPLLGGEEEEQTFHILDKEVTVSAGRTLRRPFFSTIAIRNYPWEKI